MSRSEMLEEKLREDFLQALRCNKCGNVVDDLISILKRDYVLVVKKPLYCFDCFNCNPNVSMLSGEFGVLDAYCKYLDKRICKFDAADDCRYYLNGREEARKTIARMHGELTGDLIYDE